MAASSEVADCHHLVLYLRTPYQLCSRDAAAPASTANPGVPLVIPGLCATASHPPSVKAKPVAVAATTRVSQRRS
jgi:hypothetical protein